MNIKFSLFIFSVENYESERSMRYLNSYLNDYNKKKEEEKNFIIVESFKESLFILNKKDLIESKDRKVVEEDFKKYMKKI